MPKVWNKRDKKCPKDAVYVGRPSQWGNPWTHLLSEITDNLVSSRTEAIEKHREWILSPAMSGMRDKIVKELKGKDLVCWCSPRPCHADVLLEIANELG
jgi:hypothetical protein